MRCDGLIISGVGFTDLLFNALLGFVVMFVLAFLLINPVAKSGAIDPKAEFLITLNWPDGRLEDVDLYVEDPLGELVWFRSREAGLMHLGGGGGGVVNDAIEVAGRRVINPINQETVSIRGIEPREYVVNLHLYRAAGAGPVLATVKVEKLNPSVQLVFYGPVTLIEQGDERTAVRFLVGGDGRVLDVNQLPKSIVPLRRLAAGAAGADP